MNHTSNGPNTQDSDKKYKNHRFECIIYYDILERVYYTVPLCVSFFFFFFLNGYNIVGRDDREPQYNY